MLPKYPHMVIHYFFITMLGKRLHPCTIKSAVMNSQDIFCCHLYVLYKTYYICLYLIHRELFSACFQYQQMQYKEGWRHVAFQDSQQPDLFF